MNIKDIFSKKNGNGEAGSFSDKLKAAVISVAKHPFLYSFALFLISILLGGLMLYKYVYLADRIAINAPEASFLIEQGAYQKVLQTWQEQEVKFNEADSRIYSNPFRQQVSTAGLKK